MNHPSHRKVAMLAVAAIACTIPAMAQSQLSGKDLAPLARAVDPKELASAISAGGLSEEATAAAVGEALRRQGDVTQEWDRAWGNVIEAAWKRGVLPREQFAQYALQSVVFRLAVRPIVIRGDSLPIALFTDVRLGDERAFGSVMRIREAKIGELPLGSIRKTDPYPVIWSVRDRGNDPPRFVRFIDIATDDVWTPMGRHSPNAKIAPEPANFRVDLPNGVYVASIAIDVAFYEEVDVARFGWNPPPALASTERSFRAQTSVVAVDDPTASVVFLHDDAVRDRVGKAVSVRDLEFRRGQGNEIVVGGSFAAENLPVPVAFDVFLRSGDQEWYLTSPAATPEDRTMYSGFWGHLFNFNANLRQVDVVMRPSAGAARDTIDIKKIWGEEVVIKDVAIKPAP